MTYMVENVSGDTLGYEYSETAAIEKARALLSDDPELGELIVAEWREVATVTHGPDADWQSQVVVLKPGETIQPPDDSWKMPDLDGYALTDPKHPNWHSIHADLWDAREGK